MWSLLTRSSEDFGPDIAEWCVGHALAITQALRAMETAQRARSWTPDHPERLAGQRVLIVGTGQVGRAVARAFAGLRCHVTGISRSGTSVDRTTVRNVANAVESDRARLRSRRPVRADR